MAPDRFGGASFGAPFAVHSGTALRCESIDYDLALCLSVFLSDCDVLSDLDDDSFTLFYPSFLLSPPGDPSGRSRGRERGIEIGGGGEIRVAFVRASVYPRRLWF